MSYWPPTRLCEEHDRIHRDRPTGKDAESALALLHLLSPVLWFLPKSNIYIRHHLTVSALMREIGDTAGFYRHAKLALAAMRRLCDGSRGEALPYLEGWSYLLYVRMAYRYWAKTCGPSIEWETRLTEQEGLFQSMSLPDGRVPANETRDTDRVEPDESPYVQHPAFTVIRRDWKTLIVHHDERLRGWRARLNFHVAMNYGKAVRRGSDWAWYTGWQNKRTRIRDHLWRVWFPSIELTARNTAGVTFKIAGKKKTITL